MYSPQALIAAVVQTRARVSEWALEEVVCTTEVTSLKSEHVESAATDGVYICGLFLDGASYTDMLQPAKLPYRLSPMPVMKIRPMLRERAELIPEIARAYECPVYRSESRVGKHLCTFQLNSGGKDSTGHPDDHMWILAGVALILGITN